MNKQTKILSTKTLLPNQKKPLFEAGFQLIEVDFIQTNSTHFSLETVNDFLIFTSQNAVTYFLKHDLAIHFKAKKVFCVGMKTKKMLSEAGYDVIAYTDYAENLAEIITLIYANASYSFFCGNLRRNTLPEALQNTGIVFNEIQVYTTTLTSSKIQEKVDGILFFSPSAVESYLEQNKIKTETCFCIGKTTAQALKQITQRVVIANHSSVENVLENLLHEYN